jgi:peroxiredoxin family protein
MHNNGGETMKDDKFILYVQTSDNPERQYSPLVLAQTAKAMGLKPKLYFLGARALPFSGYSLQECNIRLKSGTLDLLVA